MLTDEKLIADIDSCEVPEGQCAFWWLGQHSFVLKLGEKVIYLDPFLSPLSRRRIKPLLRPEDLSNALFITGSHDHLDHIDRPVWPAIAAAAPKAPFIVSELLVAGLSKDLDIPEDRFLGMDNGRTVEVDGIRVHAVASAHEFLDQDPETGAYPYLGFVIEGNGCKVYHSGDTCNYEGLETRLKALAPDVVMLPINGRDAERFKRGCLGNMTYQEAADLAGALKPRLTIPTHFEMFRGNTTSPGPFRQYMKVKYPDLSVHVPKHGVRVLA
jgi:L-ascorbate 6-phosphate lactonase